MTGKLQVKCRSSLNAGALGFRKSTMAFNLNTKAGKELNLTPEYTACSIPDLFSKLF